MSEPSISDVLPAYSPGSDSVTTTANSTGNVLTAIEEGSTTEVSFSESKAMEYSLETHKIDNSLYYVKWIRFRDRDCPVITQNENGPCPLIAIMNVLLLRNLVKFSRSVEYTNTTDLMKHIG